MDESIGETSKAGTRTIRPLGTSAGVKEKGPSAMATTALVTKLKNQLAAARHSKIGQRAREKGKKSVKLASDIAVIGGTGLAAGFVQGRYGAVKIPKTNIPADLALAAALVGYSLWDGGSHTHQLNNIATGLVTSNLVAFGRGAGKKARLKAGKSPLVEGSTDGDLANALEGALDGGGTLSEDDLVAVAKGTK
jgi:hypothetical protein